MAKKIQPGAPLTRREQQVLALLAKGLSNKLVAVQLAISEHTVKFHVNGVCKKLRAGSRVEAAVIHAAREAFDKGFAAALQQSSTRVVANTTIASVV